MEKEQIIKALECCFSNCSCDGCPITEMVDCRRQLERNIFALIKELTEENERLRAIPEQLHKEMSERMLEERKIERKLAVREMQTRFAMHFGTYTDKDTVKVSDVFKLLGKITEDIVEAIKNEHRKHS